MTNYHAYIKGTYLPGQWARIAKGIRERDGHRCRDCGQRGWWVHHLHYRHLFGEWRCGGCCLTLLCDRCHARRHGKRPRTMAEVERYLAEVLK